MFSNITVAFDIEYDFEIITWVCEVGKGKQMLAS